MNARTLCALGLCGWLLGLAGAPLHAEQTIGLVVNDPRAYPGYTLWAPRSQITYLIDNAGKQVHSWPSSFRPGNTAYLLENGHLLKAVKDAPPGLARFLAGGFGGRVEKLDWDGTVLDVSVGGGDPPPASRHRAVTERQRVADLVGAEDVGGGDPGRPGPGPSHQRRAVARGDPRDRAGGCHRRQRRLGVARLGSPDPGLRSDQGQLRCRGRSSRADRHLLYRWGNPRGYDRGSAEDQQLYGQHHPHWIEPGLPGAGNFLIFNNGPGRPEGQFSSIDEVVSPVLKDGSYPLAEGEAYGPAAATWVYTADPETDLFSGGLSGAQRMPNGNTLICQGRGGNGEGAERSPKRPSHTCGTAYKVTTVDCP